MTLPVWTTPQGNIASIAPGQTVDIVLNHVSDSPVAIVLLAGTLPQGLVLSAAGVISGQVATTENTPLHEFVLRMTNASGIADATFDIAVQLPSIAWNNGTNLGNWPVDSAFSYSFFVQAPAIAVQTFTSTGMLPPGLALSEHGLLHGVIAGPGTTVASARSPAAAVITGGVMVINSHAMTIAAAKILDVSTAINADATMQIQGITAAVIAGVLMITQASGASLAISGVLAQELAIDGSYFGTVYDFNVVASIATSIGTTVLTRTFVLTVTDTAGPLPVWLTPTGSIANVLASQPFSVPVLAAATDGVSPVSYTAVNLPAGVSINGTTGVISGTIASAATAIYSFSVTARVGATSATEIFTINANNVVIHDIAWSTLPGDLGSLRQGQSSTLAIAATSNSRWLRYKIQDVVATSTSINATVETGQTLVINGHVYAFTATDLTSAVALINASSDATGIVAAITSSMQLTLSEFHGLPLTLSGSALGNLGLASSYAGILPQGLQLDQVTGEIWGKVQILDTVNRSYAFTVQAYNDNYAIAAAFSIDVVASLVAGAVQVYVTLLGNDRFNWIDLITDPAVVRGQLYRPGDPEYGLIRQPRIILVANMAAATPDQVATLLSGLRRTFLNITTVGSTTYTVNGTAIYDVLFRNLVDDAAASDAAANYAGTTGTSHAGSLQNIRNRLTSWGFSGGTEALPDYMQGVWRVCIPLAFVQPGTGQAMADALNAKDQALVKTFALRIRVGSVIMAPTADASFVPCNILTDNVY